jgi:hypothetical protein
MEISSTLLERALGGVNELALPVAGATCLYLMLRPLVPAAAPFSVTRRRRRTSRLVRRGVSLLGLAVTVSSPASAAGRRHPPAPAAYEVRTEPGGSPPPRPLGSAGPRPADDRSDQRGGDGPLRTPLRHEPPWTADHRRHRHPAVHGGSRAEAAVRLFDRWQPAAPDRSAGERPQRWHAVLPGETLWSIAARRLHTDDVRRIARYWPRIHRANRDEIGPNPNLIRPGQVLELPPEQA